MSGGIDTRDAAATRQNGLPYVPSSPKGLGSLPGTSADRAGRMRSPESRPAGAGSGPLQAGDDDATNASPNVRRRPRGPRSDNRRTRQRPKDSSPQDIRAISESAGGRTPGEPGHTFRNISRRISSQSGPAPQRPKKEKVYCSNNKLDPRLQRNGGTMRVGKPSECFRQGFGAALYQHVNDPSEFIRKFSLPYEKLIPQRELWYKDAQPPPGMIRATLSQCRQRGWGAGSRELSRRLNRRRSERAQ